jgi:multidrug resistance efflux pump
MLGVLVGIGCLGFLSVPQSVTGNAEITSTPHARQTVTIPMSGRLEILVTPNQTVVPHQPIALVKSEELNKDLAEVSQKFEQVQSEVALSQQQLGPIQSQFQEVLAREAASRQKTEFLQQQLSQLSQGTLPPQMQELERGQAGIKSEIAGLQSELNFVSQRLMRYESLSQMGAIPRNQVEDLQQKQSALQEQIREKNHQVEAKAAQIATVKQNLEQQLRQQQAENAQMVAAVQLAMQQVKQAAANVQIRQQVAVGMAKELQRMRNRQQDLVLRAQTSGTVVTADLDKLNSQFLPAGSKVLEIVDLKKLTVTVLVKPEDASLVHVGDKVTFRPQGTGLSSYTGTVQSKDIDPVVQSDGVQHPPTVAVRVSLTQGDNLLRPGMPGYAHIEAEPLRLYQKVQREFVKLVPIGKFF